ncbi:ORF6N domain-containing protein [Thiomicrorhabdus sp. Milos-T2]|uniref:ORF6N domain-containing protein n=1 Tax=Thiomicrorhabdus sp. Milos-T2 TaxID=90814 RepID=UPI000494571B|nr:ORF6N domain-containing protein [Thiomicrorhabdus sp. Milos-T2]
MSDLVVQAETIQDKIFTIRGMQVMLDSDLAELYEVETKVLNQAVKRNITRFPERFCFQLSEAEHQNLRSQFVTSSKHGGRRTLPYVFTEQGVSMLSAVLRSKVAIEISVQIMDAFVVMRRFVNQHALVFERMNALEHKQYATDSKVDAILNAIESNQTIPNQGVFYKGQIFDAYQFAGDLIRSAKSHLVLIDNYVDDTTLTLLSKNQNIEITIYTQTVNKQLQLDLDKYNSQYHPIKIKVLKNVHDRFLIIDDTECYLIGASLKDLGNKLFGFSKLKKGLLNLDKVLA